VYCPLLLNWLLYADPRVAPLWRSRHGSITPIIYWLPYADHRLVPIRRSVTSFPQLGVWVIRWKSQVFQPLVGKDLYLEPKDVRAYLKNLLEFWEEIVEPMSRI
jgi:hypothetical protein